MTTPITIDKITGAIISGIGDKIANIKALEEIQAAPETIRHLPSKDLTGATLKNFVAVLGIAGEMKVAASGDGTFDVAVLDKALAKTHLSTEDKIRAKLALLGSGFERN
jgi:riboflavin synthase alpha subunit